MFFVGQDVVFLISIFFLLLVPFVLYLCISHRGNVVLIWAQQFETNNFIICLVQKYRWPGSRPTIKAFWPCTTEFWPTTPGCRSSTATCTRGRCTSETFTAQIEAFTCAKSTRIQCSVRYKSNFEWFKLSNFLYFSKMSLYDLHCSFWAIVAGGKVETRRIVCFKNMFRDHQSWSQIICERELRWKEPFQCSISFVFIYYHLFIWGFFSSFIYSMAEGKRFAGWSLKEGWGCGWTDREIREWVCASDQSEMRRSNVGDASFILHVGYLSPGRVEIIWAKLHNSLGFSGTCYVQCRRREKRPLQRQTEGMRLMDAVKRTWKVARNKRKEKKAQQRNIEKRWPLILRRVCNHLVKSFGLLFRLP